MRLKTFGALALSQHSGQCVEAKIQKRQLTVLAILAAEGPAGMSRERLLGLLWSGKEQEKARQLLTQNIHAARKALGEQVILEESARLKLNSEILPSDVDDFIASIALGHFEGAVAAYTGAYLDAIYVPDAPEFEHWVEEKRSAFARQFVEALVVLARGAQTSANHELAAGYYRRAAANDPYSATITHAFMTALATAGDVTAALNVGRVHASLVRQELEAEPDARVQQLMQELRAGNALAIHDARGDHGAQSAAKPSIPESEECLNNKVVVTATAPSARPDSASHSIGTVLKWLVTTGCVTLLVSGASQATVRTQYQSATRSFSRPPFGRSSIARESTPISLDDTDARVLYLQGEALLGRRTLASMQRAIKLFQDAIRRDDHFAPAHASLALANALLPSFMNHAPSSFIVEARTEASRALSLDSGSIQAYVALGLLDIHEHEWASAEHEMRHALTLDPKDALAHFYLSCLLADEDRATESLEESSIAFQLDPLSNAISANLAAAYYAVGRNEEAELQARRTLDLDSTYSTGHQELGFILLAEHRNSDALLEFEKGVHLEGREPFAGDLGILGYAYAVTGDARRARAILGSLDSLSRTTYVDPAAQGFVWLGLSDYDRAFRAFELSLEHEGTLLLNYFPGDPMFNSMRVDPRFAALLIRAGLRKSGSGSAH